MVQSLIVVRHLVTLLWALLNVTVALTLSLSLHLHRCSDEAAVAAGWSTRLINPPASTLLIASLPIVMPSQLHWCRDGQW